MLMYGGDYSPRRGEIELDYIKLGGRVVRVSNEQDYARYCRVMLLVYILVSVSSLNYKRIHLRLSGGIVIDPVLPQDQTIPVVLYTILMIIEVSRGGMILVVGRDDISDYTKVNRKIRNGGSGSEHCP